MGARFTVFWACRPCGSAGWLALLLTKAGDVETNPSLTTLNKKVWICYICHKPIHVRKQISIRCNRIEHWVHLRCAGIRQADKQNIPNGKMHSNCRLLPEDIVCKITQRNNIRRANTCDPALKLLNEEITSDIQKHKQNIWKEHLDSHWVHRHNTHTLWKTIHGLSNRALSHTLNTSITFNNKKATTPKHIANCFTKQFTNTQHTKKTDTLTE